MKITKEIKANKINEIFAWAAEALKNAKTIDEQVCIMKAQNDAIMAIINIPEEE